MIPNAISRLFWLRHFGSEITISWDIFCTAFINEYGEHKDYILKIFKSKIVNIDDRVELSRYIQFVYNCSGPYMAFQKACDPGTAILCTGIIFTIKLYFIYI